MNDVAVGSNSTNAPLALHLYWNIAMLSLFPVMSTVYLRYVSIKLSVMVSAGVVSTKLLSTPPTL